VSGGESRFDDASSLSFITFINVSPLPSRAYGTTTSPASCKLLARTAARSLWLALVPTTIPGDASAIASARTPMSRAMTLEAP